MPFNNLIRFTRFLRPHLSDLLLASLCIGVVDLLTLSIPLFMKILVDHVLVNKDVSLLNLLFVGMIVLIIFKLAFDLLLNLMMIALGQRIEIGIVSRFYRHIQRLSLRFFDQKQTGELIARLQDGNEIQQAISVMLLTLINNVVGIFLFGGALAYLSWKTTLLLLVFIIPFLLVTIVSAYFMRIASYDVMQKGAEFSGYLFESLSGIRIVKAFIAENKTAREVKRFLIRLNKAEFKAAGLGAGSEILGGTINMLAMLTVYWFGGHLVIKGDLTLGGLLAFVALFDRLMGPIKGLASITDDAARALAATERFYEIFDESPDIKENPRAVELPAVKGRIEFQNVYFSYNESGDVLQEINLKIEPGQAVAMVGRSGSGKTTLANLIPRFYDPASGSILIDGYDLRDVRLKSLRSQIGIVLQDTFLFSGTIRDNLTLGRKRVEEREIVAAAKAAHAHDFIMAMPEDYETRIGERGITLSGGQRQRLSIARTILKNPSILILDEATSSVDPESEALIQEALSRLIANRTSIIIAHRLSTIQRADMILVIDEGKIVERGRHKELLDQRGIYYHLCQRMIMT